MERQRFIQENTEKLEAVDENRYDSDMLGWVNVNEWGNPKICAGIRQLADEVRRNAEVLVVVGLGGSNQGARAVIDALSRGGGESGAPEVLYAALNLSADYLQKLFERIGNRSVYINVIAKNYQTLEPAVTFHLIRKYMETRYSPEEAAKRIITTPTVEDGLLHRISLENGYRFLPFPENVGGRYSVLTPVGLLPAAVAGVNILDLLRGAGDAQEEMDARGGLYCQAREYAVNRNILYNQGFGIEVLAFFEPVLESFGRWWRQLFGESEGKNYKGLFPAVCSYTEDLHSMGQYMQQGKRQMLETFLHIRRPVRDMNILPDPGFDDGLQYLEGKSLAELNENAFLATVKAHSAGGVPCSIMEIPEISEYTIGQLLYFFMKSCYYSAVLLGVEPFDQPGVENYKNEMSAALRRERSTDRIR